MKNKFVRNYLSLCASFLVWIFSFYLGVTYKVPFSGYLSIGTLALFTIVLSVNFFGSKKLYNKHFNTKIKAQRVILSQEKDKAEKDLQAVIKKLKKILVINWAIFVGLIVLYFLLFFFLTSYNNNTILLQIVFIFNLWGLLDMLFSTNDASLPDIEVYEKDYPELFKIIKEAASTVGAGKHIRVFLQGSNISVFKHKRFDCILIGDLDMNIQTRDEMKQILIHEFAHVYNKNTILTEKLISASARWQTDVGNPFTKVGKNLMKIPEFYLNREIYMFRLCASRVVEIEADKIVKKLGDRQSYVNSLAKSYSFSLFLDMPCPERDIYIYESENSTETYGETILSLYYDYLDKNESLWRRILDHELTPFLDSHPTFRMRKEAMEIDEFTFRTTETDEKYIEEQKKFLALGDTNRKKNIDEQYTEIRDYAYIKRFAAIEEYENNPNQSIQQLIETALYYEGVNNDKAKEIFDIILQKDEDNAYALYHIGRMLLNEFDERGIEYIYKAAEKNDNFTHEGLDLIGTFCIKAGLEEELLRYRRNTEEMGQDAIDKSNIISEINPKDNLLAHDLSKSTFDEILDFMLKTAAGKIEKIYLFKKVAGDIYSYIILIKRSSGVADKDFSDLYYDLFRYLDLRDEQFTLLDINNEKRLKWLTRKVKGCVVWSK